MDAKATDPGCHPSATTTRHFQSGNEQFEDHFDSLPPPVICGIMNSGLTPWFFLPAMNVFKGNQRPVSH